MSSAGRYNPVDPVAYGASVACPNKGVFGVLSALSGNNAELMKQVAALWITSTDRIVDVTCGNGAFWNLLSEIQVEKTDIESGVDCRNLPYDSTSVDVLVLDPPYQPTHGGVPNRSFGVGNTYRTSQTGLQTINDVLGLYRDAIQEAARVVRPAGGRILIKCQDMTYNHSLHLIHLDVLRLMVNAGFELADMFVLLNKSRMPQVHPQQRARRSHSYMLVGVRL